jgi:OOP family OmpA-OmpF porin
MHKKLALASFMAFIAVGAVAQTVTEIPANKGRSAYVQDSQGNIMRTPFGHCWRSALWTPTDAVAGCDGELAPPIAKPTAPAMASNSAPVVTTAPKRCDFTARLDEAAMFKPAGTALTASGKRRISDDVLSRLGACNTVESVLVATAEGSRTPKARKLATGRGRAVIAFLKSKGVKAQAGPAAAPQLEVAVRGTGK